jgi:class 3 adenylate cyclase
MLRGFAKCLGIVLLSFPVVASAAFFFLADATFPVLEQEISYRDDTSNASSFEMVWADSNGWVSQRVKPFRGTGASIRIWARFDVPPASEARRMMLRAGAWESAEYFIVRDGRLVDRQKAGTLVPLGEHTTRVTMTPALFHAGFVAVDLPPQAPISVVARLATENRFLSMTRLRFSLWDTNQVSEGELRDRYFQGAFLGVMLVLLLYNLTQFCLDIRELSYLYYVIVLVMTTIMWGMMYGLTREFLWPDQPVWDFYCLWIAAPLAYWSILQFVRQYLDTGKHFPRTDVLLKWVGYAGLMLLPTYWLPFAANHPLSLYLTLLGWVLVTAIGLPLVLGVTLLAIMKRHPLARLFFAAMFSSGIGNFITYGAWLDFLPQVEWTLNASQIGTALTGILLSMGLGFRMRQLHDELADKQIGEARLHTEHEREKRELIEEQSRGLETKVLERTAELVATQEKSDLLLANILPQAIIEELKASGQSEPRRHEEVSILFTDFSGFTEAVSTIPAKRLVQELDEIFRGFDDIIVANGLEKIKTIGDAYMAAGGLPVSAANHALRCVRAGLALTQFIEARNKTSAMKWGLRVGVHSGAVVAGIVGKNKYAYDVWGDTVNIASRLESAGEVNRVNISAYTFELVRELFDCEYRGKLAAKGKGEIDMYFVVRERTIA